MTDTEIWIAPNGDLVRMRIAGRATFACGGPVREFLLERLRSGAAGFVVDLSLCAAMDSTFVGLLAMVALRGRERAVRVELANAGQTLRRVFASLGLEGLFAFTQREVAAPEWKLLCGPPERLAAGTLRDLVREAHETLCGLEPGNRSRFEDVLGLLRRRPGADGPAD